VVHQDQQAGKGGEMNLLGFVVIPRALVLLGYMVYFLLGVLITNSWRNRL